MPCVVSPAPGRSGTLPQSNCYCLRHCPPLNPELEALLPLLGLGPLFSGLGCLQQNGLTDSTTMHTFLEVIAMLLEVGEPA